MSIPPIQSSTLVIVAAASPRRDILSSCHASHRFPPCATVDSQIDDLIAPPYDVLSEADLDELGGRSRWNITHVDVPRESVGRAVMRTPLPRCASGSTPV